MSENVDIVRWIVEAWERGGKVTRLVPDFDRDRAYADLGLAQ